VQILYGFLVWSAERFEIRFRTLFTQLGIAAESFRVGLKTSG